MTGPDSKDNKNDPSTTVRLSKLMSERGLASRREADQLISQGLVFVDGQQIKELGVKFPPHVKIELAPRALEKQSRLVTVMLNKPVGYVSAQPESGYTPAIVLLTEENFGDPNVAPHVVPQRLNDLAVCGRLDIDSQGLLLFTQDGRVAKKIIGENTEVEKEYLVRVTGPKGEPGQDFLRPADLKLLSFGMELDGKALKPAKVSWINPDQLKFILIEGKKRQVRRMCEFVGLKVQGLKRVRVGRLMLGHLPEGKWRFVSEAEISSL